MRATVRNEGVRRTTLRERNGMNQTAVPRKKTREEEQRAGQRGQLRGAHAGHQERRAKIDVGQKSKRQRSRRPRSRSDAGTVADLHQPRASNAKKRNARAASPPRKPAAPRPAAPAPRHRPGIARSANARGPAPPSTSHRRTAGSPPAEPPERATSAAHGRARPSVAPASTATPPARTMPGTPARWRAPASALRRRWSK